MAGDAGGPSRQRRPLARNIEQATDGAAKSRGQGEGGTGFT